MPSTIRYTGAAITRAQVTTITINSNTNGHTFTVTINTKVVTYTAASDTTTTIAVALCALLAARTEPEFAEITFATATNTITCTGPDDGTPFTLALGGSGTSSQATTSGTPSSPNDLSIAANYSGGALPSAADTLVFTGNAVDVKWGLTALGTTAVTVLREKSYTGRHGLPDRNPAGYPEHRTTHVLWKSAAANFESGPQDSAGQFRWAFQTAAVAITVSGEPSGVEPGQEALEVKGMPAASTIAASGGSVSVCPVPGQTAAVDGLVATGATLSLGAGATIGGAAAFTGCAVVSAAGFPQGLLVDGGSRVTLSGGASVDVSLDVRDGKLTWLASGVVSVAWSIGPGGEFDANAMVANASQFPSKVVSMARGAIFRNRGGHLSGYNLTPVECGVQDLVLELGPTPYVVT